MKTFYDFLLEAPQPAPAGGSPPSAAAPPPAPPGGTAAAPPMDAPIGGMGGPPPMGGMGGPPSLGGPPSPDLGGMGMGMGDPSQQAQPEIKIKKVKALDVFQALEKVVRNKHGQNSNKMVDSR
jgi:hypothetical protein